MFAKLARFHGLGHRHAAPSKAAYCNDTIPSDVWLLFRGRRGKRLCAAGGACRRPVGSNAFGKSRRSTRRRAKSLE